MYRELVEKKKSRLKSREKKIRAHGEGRRRGCKGEKNRSMMAAEVILGLMGTRIAEGSARGEEEKWRERSGGEREEEGEKRGAEGEEEDRGE